MKRFNFIAVGILLVVLTTEYVQSQTLRDRFIPQFNPQGTLDSGFTSWQWLNPLPQGNTLFDVQMIDSNFIYTVGEYGTFLRTTNGGKTWAVKHSIAGINSTLQGLYFFNRDSGIVVGEEGIILRTTNSGNTWEKQKCGTIDNLADIVFVNPDTGFIVGWNGTILQTSDGGRNWSKKIISITNNLHAIFMNNSRVGCAVGDDGIILKTTDCGISWNTQVSGTTEALFAISFSNDSIGLITGAYGIVIKTTDGGSSWSIPEYLPVEGCYTMSDVFFTNDSSAVIIGSCGYVFRTTDCGTIWEYMWGAKVYLSLLSVSFIGNQNGIAVGEGGLIVYTKNGGEDWEDQSSRIMHHIEDIYFTDINTGIAVGLLNDGEGIYGVILRTTDAGITWNIIVDENIAWLSAVHFSDYNNGMAVGDGGTILRTKNGGITWEKINSGVIDWLFDVYMIDSNNIVVVGCYRGTILHTTDGGENWMDNSIGDGNWLNGISFVDKQYGLIVGFSGRTDPAPILRTSDGGNTWINQTSGTSKELSAVSYIDTNTAIVVGDSGIILRTTDSGNNWNVISSGTLNALFDVSFIGSNTGIIVGGNGTVLQTTNAGQRWNMDQLPTSFIRSICITKSVYGNVAYLAGSPGRIFCAAISPLNPKTWAWTGLYDSSWHNPDNWLPVGTPLPGDSVIIAHATHSPIIDSVQQQIVIASLNILSGGKLTITDVLPRFVVLADVTVYGTLEIRPPAATTIIVGGNWNIEPGGSNERFSYLSKQSFNPLSDEGFVPSRSTVLFSGNGTMAGNFYNLMFDTTSSMRSNGNILLENQCTMIGDLDLGVNDTLFVQASFAQALVGPGKFTKGTVKRTIESSSIEPYGFESSSSCIQFNGSGTYPSAVAITTLADTNPTSFGNRWVVVPSHIDPVANVITADSVTGFSKWVFGIPRPTEIEGEFYISGINDTIPLIRRVYEINAEGGSEFKARLSLRYDQSEVPEGIQEDSLKLLRMESTVDVKEQLIALPKEFSLSQNYPNPFNPSTTIRYELPKASFVTLKVYNLLGQEVAKLVDEKRGAGGYDVEFNGAKFPSGLYFYRIQADKYVETKKLLLLK